MYKKTCLFSWFCFFYWCQSIFFLSSCLQGLVMLLWLQQEMTPPPQDFFEVEPIVEAEVPPQVDVEELQPFTIETEVVSEKDFVMPGESMLFLHLLGVLIATNWQVAIGSCVGMCVCVCVWEWGVVCVCVCVLEWASEWVCVCVCMGGWMGKWMLDGLGCWEFICVILMQTFCGFQESIR